MHVKVCQKPVWYKKTVAVSDRLPSMYMYSCISVTETSQAYNLDLYKSQMFKFNSHICLTFSVMPL